MHTEYTIYDGTLLRTRIQNRINRAQMNTAALITARTRRAINILWKPINWWGESISRSRAKCAHQMQPLRAGNISGGVGYEWDLSSAHKNRRAQFQAHTLVQDARHSYGYFCCPMHLMLFQYAFVHAGHNIVDNLYSIQNAIYDLIWMI